MAGFFDLFGEDPSQGLPLLGLLAGLGQASGASRLPVTTGQVLGSAAGGLLAGRQAGQEYGLNNLKLQEGQLGLASSRLGMARQIEIMKAMGMPVDQGTLDALGLKGTPSDSGTSNTTSSLTPASPAVSPTQPTQSPADMTKLPDWIHMATQTAESANNPDAVGPEVPGQGTAKGLMQVMDATNISPGFGVKPAADNSAAERTRVGNDYLDAMYARYKNPALALAAYNWGPGNLDGWIKAGADPNKIPGSVKSYVSSILAQQPQQRPTQVAANVTPGVATDTGGGGGESNWLMAGKPPNMPTSTWEMLWLTDPTGGKAAAAAQEFYKPYDLRPGGTHAWQDPNNPMAAVSGYHAPTSEGTQVVDTPNGPVQALLPGAAQNASTLAAAALHGKNLETPFEWTDPASGKKMTGTVGDAIAAAINAAHAATPPPAPPQSAAAPVNPNAATAPSAVQPGAAPTGTMTLPTGPTAPAGFQSGPSSAEAAIQANDKPLFEKVSDNATNSNNMLNTLDQMKRDLVDISKPGFLITGARAPERLGWAIAANTTAKMFGMPAPFDENAVAHSLGMNKLAAYQGFSLSRTLGSREAVSIVQQAMSVQPNISLTPEGNKLLIGSLQSAAQRDVDRLQWLTANKDKYPTLTEANFAFDKTPGHTPQDYAMKAWQLAGLDPKKQYGQPQTASGTSGAVNYPAPSQQGIALLKMNPKLRTQFDAKFGPHASDQYLGPAQ